MTIGSAPRSVDLLVIGGGINGAGIARDAAGRGLSVLLCEQDDLASGTSSRSGKLVHGGLRYLEYYDFRLVREALIEREVLLAAAPHIIWPLRFVYAREAEYLCRVEWARTAEDILERRTKHGLHLRDDEKRSLHLWLQHASPTVDA
jgi:glycerol-3-phosphate dehydrogenase